METLKRKILGIHSETAEAVSKMAVAERTLAQRSSELKTLEKELGQLMKSVSKKENELDQSTATLEKTEKKIEEKSQLLKQALTDKSELEQRRPTLEKRIAELQELATIKDKEVTNALTKSEGAERDRKAAEHVLESLETQIEDRSSQIREAKYLSEEASRKECESMIRMDAVKKALTQTLKRAENKEKEVRLMEDKLSNLGNCLNLQMAKREQSNNREEMRKRQIGHLQQQMNEAEKRALAEENIQARLQQRVQRMRKVEKNNA